MATISRFDRFTPRDYQMQWFVPQEVMPNIDAWNSLLSQQQQKYDATKMLLSDKLPKYLQTEEDRQLFNQYKTMVDESLLNIAKEYQEKGVTSGNRVMKDAIRNFSKQWQPGGMASTLEDRYTGYQTALQEIEKSYKDDPRGINKQFATFQLQKQLSEPLGYNAETGEYKRISTPELYKDPNIQNLILKAINEVQESGTTDIVRLSPTMLQKIKTEGRSAQTLQNVAKAIYEQYPKQLAIEAWYKSQGIDPEQAKEEYSKSLDSGLQRNQELIENKSKLSKEQVKSLQSDLVKQGYDIKIDGSFGPKTEEALKDYNSKLTEEVNQKKQSFNLDEYMMSQVKQNYNKFASQFANQKTDKSIIFDQAELTRQKIAASRRNTQSLISGFQQIVNPETNLIGVTPDKGVNIEAWDKQYESANKNLEQAKDVYYKLMSGKAGKVLGTSPNNVNMLIEAYSKSGGDPNKFSQIVKSDSRYWALDNVNLSDAFNYIQNNNDVITQATSTYIQAEQQVEMLKSTQDSFTKQYSESEGKKEFEDLKRRYKKPWETDEQFRQAINNKDSRFNKTQSTSVRRNEFTDSKENISSNEAEIFLSKRNRAVKSNPEYAKSVRTYAISAPKEDKVFGSFSQSILNDIDNNDYYGYVDEGQQGFSWKTKDGKDKEGIVSNKKLEVVSFGETGSPQFKVTGIIKNEDGKEEYVETYLNVPETKRGQLKQVMLGTKAQAKRTNDAALDETADYVIAGIDGNINYSKQASQDAIKLHLENTENIPIITPIYNQAGEITNTRSTNMRGMLVDTDEVGGRVYKKYKVLGDDGNMYYRLTMQTPKGEVVVTNKNGGIDFRSSSSVDILLEGKKNDLGLPVEATINKVPQGTFVPPAQIGSLLMTGESVNEELLDTDTDG